MPVPEGARRCGRKPRAADDIGANIDQSPTFVFGGMVEGPPDRPLATFHISALWTLARGGGPSEELHLSGKRWRNGLGARECRPRHCCPPTPGGMMCCRAGSASVSTRRRGGTSFWCPETRDMGEDEGPVCESEPGSSSSPRCFLGPWLALAVCGRPARRGEGSKKDASRGPVDFAVSFGRSSRRHTRGDRYLCSAHGEP